jgi:cell division protein FtsQ
MQVKRKISARKILQLVVTVIVTTGCVLAMTSASKVQQQKKIKGININIKNDKYGFIDKQQVKDILLNDRHIDLMATSLGNVNVHKMENIITANPWVANAQVYIDNKQIMHVNVTQRVPVARLFEQSGNSYYLDHTLKSMPLSDKYIHYTTVVTNVPELKDDSASTSLKAQIVSLVSFIDKDTFWSAQVSQVILGDDQTFEIVPVLGNQRILLGDTSRMQEKFHNLFAFYKKVLNRIGWEKYELIDVRFNGQVVASPALQWKIPKDNTMGNMDWVKAVIGSEPIQAMPDTPGAMQITMPAAVASTPVTSKPAAVTHVATPAPPPAAAKKAEAQVVKKQDVVAKKQEPAKPKLQAKAAVKKPIEKKETKKIEAKAAVKKTEEKKEKKEEAKPKYIYGGQ